MEDQIKIRQAFSFGGEMSSCWSLSGMILKGGPCCWYCAIPMILDLNINLIYWVNLLGHYGLFNLISGWRNDLLFFGFQEWFWREGRVDIAQSPWFLIWILTKYIWSIYWVTMLLFISSLDGEMVSCFLVFRNDFGGRAVLILRNPYDSLLSNLNFLYGGHKGSAPGDLFQREGQLLFLKIDLTNHSLWLTKLGTFGVFEFVQ